MHENFKKYSFKDDYSEGAHPNILRALCEFNLSQQSGYGKDEYSLKAAELIREMAGNKNADVYFVSGGTQANLIVLSSMLRPYESVISASTGHINVHEAGAIEATGHKIKAVETQDGKLTSLQIKDVLGYHTDEHMVKPRVVFISNSTEIATIYLKKELETLSKFCKSNNLLLYLDGARLGSALVSERNDLTLSDIARLTDVFYIGGTKNGALLGEAIVIINDDLKKDFRFNLKQKGALLAKGRILGVQFLELFKDDLYFNLARHANSMALKLAEGIRKHGYTFLSEIYTNQIFPIFPNLLIEKLSKRYEFYVWAKVDKDNSAIRLVSSWATKENMVDSFLEDLNNCL